DTVFIEDTTQIVPTIPVAPTAPVVYLFVGAGHSSLHSKALASFLERHHP
ncbi:MAG: hypothetical protein GX462_08745, partial [Thermotogaceae bacterium]|nr:hypothetical protein [Thermotogaceae bacterium]